MNILVTGGAGYIGSHTCVELLKANHSIIIVDNLINSKIETINKIKQLTKKDLYFYQIDVTNELAVNSIFSSYKIDGVIHFAGLKSVGESIKKPLEYYNNNLLCTMTLVKACIKFNVNKFVFSSSAAIYGDNEVPFVETMDLLPPTNPYAETKAISERILKDVAKAYPNFSISLLRYFNPIGANESGLLGEEPKGTFNNLMPYIIQVAKGEIEKLKIFGDDYPTLDGTGVRDYIHVVDLAEGHLAAIERIKKGIQIYNLGTGQGTSVIQLVRTFEETNSVKVPYEIVGRRAGDIASCYADVSKAKKELGWNAKRGIECMCRDSWNFEKNKSLGGIS